jgi:23S rRNA pseudouridine2605 synthase
MPRPPHNSQTHDDDDQSHPDDESSMERLQKVLASAGIGSRRHCEEYIRDGRVTIDGETVVELGIKVDSQAQKVCVDGERIKFQKKQYFIVNKPTGVVCSNADPQGRPRVIDLLPPWHGRLFSVGRLDESSEGLLIVTNDGELAHALAHPRFQVERVYRCIIAGIPTDETFKQLRQGLHFTEGKFRVRDVRRIKSNAKSKNLFEIFLKKDPGFYLRPWFSIKTCNKTSPLHYSSKYCNYDFNKESITSKIPYFILYKNGKKVEELQTSDPNEVYKLVSKNLFDF